MPFYEVLKILMTQNNKKFKRKSWERKYDLNNAFIVRGYNGQAELVILICRDGHTGYTFNPSCYDIIANDWCEIE